MLLTDQQQMVREAALDFSQRELRPNAAKWDTESTFPREALAGLGALGLMGINVPEEWGGAGADYVSMAVALEEIARGDASTSTIVSGHNSVGCMPIFRFGNDEQRERYLRPLAQGKQLAAFLLTEAHGGSDAGAPRTTAQRDGDYYILNGDKQFITSGSTADIAIVFAATGPRSGKDITAFIVPTSIQGYNVTRVERKMGQHASDTAQITLDNVRIHESLRLGEEGQGYRIALANLEGGRIGIAAQSVGIAQAALDAAIPYARERQVFGKPIIEHQAVGFRIAAMATRIETARQMVWHAAALKDADKLCLMEACMAKLVASETAEWVCSEAIQVLGGYGYLTDFPVERLYRDARVCKIYEGTNDIQHIVILRELLRS
ncbi:acyl-CoA dehydrogenase family protein [Alcaligenaceae bacterium]|nr:acyl-CoA dehydrogenase family protein [Alcaligenaceae bacterium]